MSHIKLLSRTQKIICFPGLNLEQVRILYTYYYIYTVSRICNFSQEQNPSINIQYIVGPMVIYCFYVIMVLGCRSTLDSISMASLFCILDSTLLNRIE